MKYQGQKFDGATYDHTRDSMRLGSQLERVYSYMKDEKWHSLNAIAKACDAPHASVSARLRDLRKPKFGSHKLHRKLAGKGLYLYRLEVPER